MNGFLKARRMLFTEPLAFDAGSIVVPAGNLRRSTPTRSRQYTRDHAPSHARVSG